MLFHQDPYLTDDEVDALELRLDSPGSPRVVAAREGATIHLPGAGEGHR